jgi:hypothetical protein
LKHPHIALVIAGLLSCTLRGYAAGSATDPGLPAATPDAMQLAIKQQRESIDKQRQSVHQQVGEKLDSSAASFFIDPLPPLPQADCGRLDSPTVNSLIADAAKKQALQPALLHAVMKQESGFKPCAVSVRGAQGLMQLMPATAQQLHVADPFDPVQNVQGGAAYLKQLLTRYKGDLRLALVAYNAGTQRADQPDPSNYPAETQGYLASIFATLGMQQMPAATDPEGFAPLPDVPAPADPPVADDPSVVSVEPAVASGAPEQPATTDPSIVPVTTTAPAVKPDSAAAPGSPVAATAEPGAAAKSGLPAKQP